MAHTLEIPTPDGTLDGYLALPPAGHGPGLVVLQEIFGVGDYVKAATDRLAGHAFDNPSPMFHDAEAAARAWEITREFLARTLPVP